MASRSYKKLVAQHRRDYPHAVTVLNAREWRDKLLDRAHFVATGGPLVVRETEHLVEVPASRRDHIEAIQASRIACQAAVMIPAPSCYLRVAEQAQRMLT